MVLAFEESCRVHIEHEYRSIVEFKRDVHKAMSVFNQEQLQKALDEIYEALQPVIENIRELTMELYERELTMELYETSGFLPLNEDLYIAPIPKHAPVMKLNKVPVNYSINVRAPQIPHRCRSNC